jgi:hypothetical protein
MRIRGELMASNFFEEHLQCERSQTTCGRSRMYALIAPITAFLTPLAQHGVLVLLRRYWGDDWNLAETALFFGGFTALILFGVLINLFDAFLWHTRVGGWMFRLAGLTDPPNLAGEYRGAIELNSATDPAAVYRTEYSMRIAQSWEQICLLIERESEAGGLGGTSRSYVTLAVAFSFTAVLLLIADLDRPAEGWLEVSPQALVDLRRSITEPGP